MLKETIKNDLISAMKEKNKVLLNTLRAVKGAVQLEVINNKKEENDELYLDVINKQIKMRNDSIEEFKNANRIDLVESYQQEVDILKKYMPSMLSEDELNDIIDNVISSTKAESIKDFGNVMKEITPLVKNRCDMKELSNSIKERLNH
jgi:uncharacterized protein YqeY